MTSKQALRKTFCFCVSSLFYLRLRRLATRVADRAEATHITANATRATARSCASPRYSTERKTVNRAVTDDHPTPTALHQSVHCYRRLHSCSHSSPYSKSNTSRSAPSDLTTYTSHTSVLVCSAVGWSSVTGRPKRTNKPRAKATSPCSPFAGVFRISHRHTR